MRMAWWVLAVKAFLRRWAIYLLVLAVLFAGGSVGAWTSITGLAAWSVLPLFYATAHPVWLPLVFVVQIALTVGLVWALRSLLWFAPWAEAERALPLPAADLRRSDLVVILLVLTPLLCLYLFGAATLWFNDPPWLHAVRERALAVLAFTLMASVALGVMLLHFLRQPPRPTPMARRAGLLSETVRSSVSVAVWRATPVSVIKVLLLLPLFRGPARRVGFSWCGGGLLLCMPALGLWLLPQAASWWLAAFALLSLMVTTRVQTLARDGLDPLWLACNGWLRATRPWVMRESRPK